MVESSSGKTTTLSFIAGEISPIDLKKLVEKQSERQKIVLGEEQETVTKDQYLNSQTASEVLQSLNVDSKL